MSDTPEPWHEAVLDKGASVQDAIRSLDRSSQQIVLVVDGDGRLVGTITDGDIRRGMLRGIGLDDAITSIIHREPMVSPRGLERHAAVQLMRSNGLQQLPVVDEDRRVVGLHTWTAVNAPENRPNMMVIMAGGRGTRLYPHTEHCPKPMLLVGGKPILERIIERARDEGFRHFVLAVHHLAHIIDDHFGDGSRWGVSITYLREEQPLGTGGALALLPTLPAEPLLVTNGDVLSDVRYGEILDFHLRHEAVATMAVRPHEWQNPFGVVLTEGLNITGFEEKPVVRSRVNAGIYVLDPTSLGLLERAEYCDMPTLFERLQSAAQRTIVYPMHEAWLDVGRPADLERARAAQAS